MPGRIAWPRWSTGWRLATATTVLLLAVGILTAVAVWWVYFRHAQAHADGKIVPFLLPMALVLAGAWVVLQLGLHLLVRHVVARPLERLVAQAQAIAADPERLGQQIPEPAAPDLAALAYAFNVLSTHLRHHRDALGDRVEQRTAQLSRMNEQFAAEIAEHQRTAAALRVSEQYFRRLFESNMIGIFFWDPRALVITDANDALLKLIGYTREDLAARRLTHDRLLAPERHAQSAQSVATLFATGMLPPTEGVAIHRDGRRIPILVGAAFADDRRTRAVSFVLDLTAQRAAQETARRQHSQLAHLARVTTMGQMATSLAHELNQPLGAIRNYAGVAQDALDDPRQRPLLETAIREILAETTRAAEIIQRLRDFIRRRTPQTTQVRVEGLIASTLGLLAFDLSRRGVQVETRMPEGPLPPLQANAIQLQQVLVNLLTNAADAIEILPPTQRRVLLAVSLQPADGLRGPRLIIAVQDRGPGAADLLPRLFEPFFTTKSEGLGMGLPISQAIIQDHGGTLTAMANDPEPGLTFQIALPVDESPPPSPTPR